MGWLERRRMPLPPAHPPADCVVAIRAWNLLGGLDWAGLDDVCELVGADDPETLIAQLIVLRNNPELLGDG